MADAAIPDVKGKVALITGASQGLGAGLAERWAGLGVRLVLCSRRSPVLAESEDVISRSVDVCDEDAVEALAAEAVQKFGGIDLWVNNAGVLDPVAPLRSVAPDAFRKHIEINLTGVFIGTRCYANQIRASKREGVLINVSSGAASNPYQGWGAYCAGKAAVDQLTAVAAAEEAEAGLRAHAIAPGVIDTPMQDHVREASAADFPDVERFHELKRDGILSHPNWVADEFLRIAFDPARRTDEVALRLEQEPK